MGDKACRISRSIFYCLAFIFMMPLYAHSEIYKNIGPLDTLGDVKAMFPGANFEKQSPAWATNYDAMYKITGEGLSGSILIKFNDYRSMQIENLNEILAEKNRRLDPDIKAKVETIKETSDFPDYKTYTTDDLESSQVSAESLANSPDEKALTVSWVRWVPNYPIPLERFITKYGKPDESGFSDEDMEPYKAWRRGLYAHLTDDGKKVLMVDYSFTQEDRALAWSIKFPNSKYNPYVKKSKPKTQPTKKKK